jgi:hypothetical protein
VIINVLLVKETLKIVSPAKEIDYHLIVLVLHIIMMMVLQYYALNAKTIAILVQN